MQHSLLRLITISLFAAVLGGTWDVWWHAEIGRETFWSPPHLLLYAGVIVAIGAGCYGWWKTREKRWQWLALVLLLVPASAPFDEVWHRVFGVEAVNSPLIVWSPPHVVLVLAFITAFLVLFHYVQDDVDPIARHLLQSALLASILSLLFFLISPLEPTGPYHLLGFTGAGFAGGIVALTLLYAQENMRRFGSAVSVAVVFLVLMAIEAGHNPTPTINVAPHEHPPGWLLIFATLLPAVLIDVLRSQPVWIRGSVVGLLHGGILFGFAWRFFAPEFQYGASEMWTAILSSVIAGSIAGLAVSTFSQRQSTSLAST